MNTMIQNLRYAVRQLSRNPGFAAAVVATLALGIGANTAIFSVVNGVLLRPLPFPQPDRLVDADYALSGEYLLLREETRRFDELALYTAREGVNLVAAGDPERVAAVRASANLFRALGVPPLHGRDFLPDEERPGAERVVILSHGLWRERFGADPGLVGREILIDSEPRTVVGVMPAGFRFPDTETRLWLPFTLDAGDPVALWGGGGGWLLGRLAVGATLPGAEAEVRALGPRIREANTLWAMVEGYGVDRRLVQLRESIVGDARTSLLILLGAVGFVLLIACANVANLLLARSVARLRELAIRTALGAGRGHLFRQLLTESALLAVLGGGVGLLVAVWAVRFFAAGLPLEMPRLGQVGIDGSVLAFTAALTLFTAFLFGLLPAVRAARDGARAADLRERGGRGTAPGRRRLSGALVTVQVALAMVLVVGAGLMGRTLLELGRVDPGFDPARLVSARVTPPETRYADAASQRAFLEDLLDRVGGVPGLGPAEAADELPLAPGEGAWGGFAFETEDEPYVPGTAAPTVAERRVTSGYFRMLGVPLLSGRPLMEADREGAPHVALINEAMAREVWPAENPVGKRFRPVWWREEWITVVGVVADIRQRSLARLAEPEIYRPIRQTPVSAVTLVLRTPAGPGTVAGALREVVASVDPLVPVSDVRSVADVRAGTLSEPRFLALLLGLFALVALGLGALGIYGLIAYGVVERRREFGVRIALGARAADIRWLVLGKGLRLVIVGLAIGTAVALLVSRTLEALLFGVGPRDPWTFGGVALVLAATAVLACWIPARRATRADPIIALRAE